MLSPHEQKNVWEEWLSSEVRANYFADLSYRYQHHQRIVTWLTLAFSSGASVTLIADVLPPALSWVRPVLALMTAGLSLWLLVAQNQRNGLDCADLHFRWNRLANQYETLWDRMYSPQATAKLKNLTEKTAELSKSSTAFPNYPKLILKWQDYVVAQHAADVAA